MRNMRLAEAGWKWLFYRNGELRKMDLCVVSGCESETSVERLPCGGEHNISARSFCTNYYLVN